MPKYRLYTKMHIWEILHFFQNRDCDWKLVMLNLKIGLTLDYWHKNFYKDRCHGGSINLFNNLAVWLRGLVAGWHYLATDSPV